MKSGSTFILRAVIIAIGLLVLTVCILMVRLVFASDQAGYKPILIGMYAPAIAFFVALWQALKLLGYIDKSKAFSQASVDVLKKIKYCAFIISGLYTAGLPYIYHVADKDDAPGVVAIALVFVGASFVIGVAAAVCQRLFQSAVDIKSENDLTV